MRGRGSSLGVLSGRRVFRWDSAGEVILLCVLAASTALAQIHGSDNPSQKDQLAAEASEPVSIESRKSVSSPATAAARSGVLRVNETFVLINVTVTDPLNRFVTGLEKEHFRLFEDKTEQEITDFSSEDARISIGLVFDTSGSMGSKLQKSLEASAEFFKATNPADALFMLPFRQSLL
jgi:hypothetical protein